MKIVVTQEIGVEISDSQADNICLQVLYKKFNWGPNFYIKGDKVYETITIHTTHSSTEEVFRRQASKTDQAIHDLIKNWSKEC